MPKNVPSALDIFDPSSYPTRRDEDWKYSDLSRVLRVVPERAEFRRTEGVSTETNVLVSNGNYPDLRAAAASGRMSLHHVGWSQEHGVLGHQGVGDISIEAGQSLAIFETYSDAAQRGDDGRVDNLNDSYVGSTELRFQLGKNASLIRVVILDEPADAVSIRRSTVTAAPGATFKQYVFSTGAMFQRFETHVEHAGHGASVELHGAYLLKDKAHFDLTTRVNHAQPDGITQQLIKGLVKDQATAVFQGRIKVERGADGTDARMRHHALMLNDRAHIRAKPELEIYADDVQCAHGNTIGAMDEAALFFCQSRGMDEATARQLLMQAFIAPVADLIEDEELRIKVLAFLEEKSRGFYAV